MYSNEKVVIEQLSVENADFIYELYSNLKLVEYFDESPILQNETSTEFTERIISLCEYIFTIRPIDQPDLIIGDCALHHWNQEKKEIEIGGSLLPEFWGKGYMQSAFELLTVIAKQELGVETLLGQTKARNLKAIRFSEKMGFEKYKFINQDTIMKKVISRHKLP